MRIIYVYVEERTLTLPSSFNCMPNFLQSYPQHYAICLTQNIGEFPNLLLAQYMLLEDQTLTLSSFFNCTIRLTSARPRIAITIVIFIHAWDSGSDSDEGSESIGYGSSDEPEDSVDSDEPEDSVDSDGDEMFPPRRPPVKTLKEKASKHSSKKRRVK